MPTTFFTTRNTPALVTTLIGVVISIMAFVIVGNLEANNARRNFERAAFDRLIAIEKNISLDLRGIKSIAAFFNSSFSVGREDFHNFVAPILASTYSFQALEWIPRIPAAERGQFEQRARDTGHPDFQIKERTSQGKIVPATKRDEYFPVYYLEPYGGNERSLGFDLGSCPTRTAVMEKARDSGKMVFSKLIRLIQETDTQHGILAITPIYRNKYPIDTIAQRRKNLTGFILGVIRIHDAIESAFSEKRHSHNLLTPGEIDIYIYDQNTGNNDTPLHIHNSRSRTQGPAPPLTFGDATRNAHIAHALELGAGKSWLAIARPIASDYGRGISWLAWATLLIMLVFTGFMVTYINLSVRRKEDVDQLVNERTRSLQKSEGQNKAIVDNILDGLVTITEHGIIQSFNQAAVNIFGYSPDEAIGQNVNILMPQPYQREHDGYLHNYISTGHKKIIGIGREVQGMRKDGSIFPLDLAVSELNLDNQHIFIGIIRDISSRKLAEEKLHEVTALRQAILDSANFSIIFTDVNGIIRSFNNGAERMLGYQAAEVVDKVTPEIIHDKDEIARRAADLSEELGHTIKPGFEVFITRARHGMADEQEWSYIRKDGTHFPVLLSITAVHDTEGNIIGFLGIASDLTERKKIDRMKSEFISTVSHELRTPLTSIRGALSLVLGKSANNLSDKTRHMLEMASRNSERLTYLINDLLDLEKLGQGKLEFNFRKLDITNLTQQAIEVNEGFATKHNVHLRLIENTATTASVYGDEQRLLQVFANLISNAVKYSPKNSTVELRLEHHKNMIRISIRDHGPGIPEEFRSRIFERFSQADSSDSREKGGTGLGLAISKAIVEQHGGTIDFIIREHEGSEFYFEIPEGQGINVPLGLDSERPDVLICEDNHDVAHVLSRLLDHEGLTSEITTSAKGALELLENNTYSLMLLDLTLPDSDGLELLREIRKAKPASELPVIVISGRANEGRLEFNGDTMTVVDWLQKPVDRDALSRALDHALRGNTRPRVLHIEDDPDIIQIVQEILADISTLEYVNTLTEARKRIHEKNYDLVILDTSLPDGSGLDLIEELKGCCPVVIFSGQEHTSEVSRRVAAALTKSNTSGEQLMATIKHILGTK